MILIDIIRFWWRTDPGELLIPLLLPAAVFVAALWAEVLV